MMCCQMERIPDPPKDVPHVPATVAWDDHGAERTYTFTNDDGTNIMVPMYDPLLEDIVGRHGHGRRQRPLVAPLGPARAGVRSGMNAPPYVRTSREPPYVG